MNRTELNYLYPATAAIIMAAWAVISIIQFQVDIPLHVMFIERWHLDDPAIRMYSIYFHVLNLLSFNSGNQLLLNVAAVTLLATLVILKFMITFKAMNKYAGFLSFHNLRSATALPLRFLSNAALLVLLLCICQNLVYKFSATMALGYIPVNTWHNSTTIALMPVALLLFFRSFDFITAQRQSVFERNGVILLLLTVLSLLIKPSYFLVFVIAFPVFYLINHGIIRSFITVILICTGGLVTLYLINQYVYSGSATQVIIHPFEAWKIWSTNIPLSLLMSVFYPLSVVAVWPRKALNDKLLQYAWLNFLIALLIYILFFETGERAYHGNFSWQTIVCNYILFLTSTIFLIRQATSKVRAGRKLKIVVLIFLAHVFTGLLFILKMPFFGPR